MPQIGTQCVGYRSWTVRSASVSAGGRYRVRQLAHQIGAQCVSWCSMSVQNALFSKSSLASSLRLYKGYTGVHWSLPSFSSPSSPSRFRIGYSTATSLISITIITITPPHRLLCCHFPSFSSPSSLSRFRIGYSAATSLIIITIITITLPHRLLYCHFPHYHHHHHHHAST